MRFDMKVNFAVLFLLLGALLFSSCGAKKKSTSGPLVGGVRPNKNAPISDASDALGMEYSKDKLENYAALLGVKQKELDNKSLYYVIDEDRKSTRLNSSHVKISYAVFCLKKKKKNRHK